MKGPAIYIGHVLDERGAPFDNVERELSELGIDDPFNLTRCNAYDGFLHFENKTNAADLEMIADLIKLAVPLAKVKVMERPGLGSQPGR